MRVARCKLGPGVLDELRDGQVGGYIGGGEGAECTKQLPSELRQPQYHGRMWRSVWGRMG
jgi:hypothetical protein